MEHLQWLATIHFLKETSNFVDEVYQRYACDVTPLGGLTTYVKSTEKLSVTKFLFPDVVKEHVIESL